MQPTLSSSSPTCSTCPPIPGRLLALIHESPSASKRACGTRNRVCDKSQVLFATAGGRRRYHQRGDQKPKTFRGKSTRLLTVLSASLFFPRFWIYLETSSASGLHVDGNDDGHLRLRTALGSCHTHGYVYHTLFLRFIRVAARLA